MHTQSSRPLRGYLVGLAAVAGALLLTEALRTFANVGVSPLFLAAVMIAAWHGGLAGGMLAAALAVVGAACVLLSRDGTPAGAPDTILRLAVLGGAALSVGWVTAALKRAADRA